ncbi:MAG: hypothetical protein V1728_03785 [Candidatus Micrarchaeota archaeon]
MVPPTVSIKRGVGNSKRSYRIPNGTIEDIALKAKEKADPCLCEYYKYEQCLKGVRNALDTYSRRHSLNQDLRMRRILDEHIWMASIKDFEPYRTPEEITGFLRPILQAGFEAWETGEAGEPAQGSPGQVIYIPSNDKIDRTINTLGEEMSFTTLKDKYVERAHPNSQHRGKGKLLSDTTYQATRSLGLEYF